MPPKKRLSAPKATLRKKQDEAYLRLANDETLSREEFLKRLTPAQRRRHERAVSGLVRLADDIEIYGGSQDEFD